jgi:hypothetical protein
MNNISSFVMVLPRVGIRLVKSSFQVNELCLRSFSLWSYVLEGANLKRRGRLVYMTTGIGIRCHELDLHWTTLLKLCYRNSITNTLETM